MTLQELKAKKKEIDNAIKVLEIGGEYATNGCLKYELKPNSDYPYQVSASSSCMVRYHKKGEYIERVGHKWFPFIRCKTRNDVLTAIDTIVRDLRLLKTDINNLPDCEEARK